MGETTEGLDEEEELKKLEKTREKNAQGLKDEEEGKVISLDEYEENSN